MGEQPARHPRVLAEDRIDRLERFESVRGHITQIADRRRNDEQRS